MTQFLQIFILLPLIGFLLSIWVPKRKENMISGIAISIFGIHLISLLLFSLYWISQASPLLDIKHFVIFKTGNIEIFIDFYFDKFTAVFSLIGSSLVFLVGIFSRYYMHREGGFKRYFITILLFFIGYNLIIFSGNFETLFMGWEILGVSSFLLISFYRERYLPVKNALKVISIYRLSDMFLILAMWMSHHLWHENITFFKLNDINLVQEHLLQHNWYGVFIALMIVFAAIIKSAQFPFSSWLPRAMEGPTTSSAIFYGSLSIHIGVFLLLRTYPYWESLLFIKIVIIGVGLLTGIIASSIARVQSTVKTQIAYASVTQIGIIFIEIALGLHTLAIIHFAGNAFLRTYQLLVSPSVLSYLIHDMVFSFKGKNILNKKPVFTNLKNSFYILAVKEWNLDYMMKYFLWNPFKYCGRKLDFLFKKISIYILVLIFLFSLFCNLNQDFIPQDYFDLLPFLASFIGLMLIVKSFTERESALRAWWFIIFGQLFITLSISLLNEKFKLFHVLILLSGTVLSASIGYLCLIKIKNLQSHLKLDNFYGNFMEHPKIEVVFLLSCLGFIGLPFTPTFIGIDLLFSHIHKHQELLIISTSLSFIFIEISLLRIYARIFLGPDPKGLKAVAFRSS